MHSQLARAILSCYVVEGDACEVLIFSRVCRKINCETHAHYRQVHIFRVFERAEIFEFNISLGNTRVRIDIKIFSTVSFCVKLSRFLYGNHFTRVIISK